MPQEHRYLKAAIEADAIAHGKMAFITGPRQVGKTTLAKSLLQSPENYFTWDDDTFQRRWARNQKEILQLKAPGPVVLDEVHKDKRWKNKLKGVFDTMGAGEGLIITGSARLDIHRKGSDSLMGRYFPYRLHPFSVAESSRPSGPGHLFEGRGTVNHRWRDLMAYGGYPEPLLGANEDRALRWSRLRLERLVREDAQDVQGISDLNAFQVLANLLVPSAAQSLSINSLREDVGVAYATVRSWYHVLEALFYCFTIKPYSKSIKRALRAEPKLYLYDILRIPVESAGARRENLAALHLLKACHYWTDTAQGEFDLCFVKDKEKREVDFLVTKGGKPWMLVECKSNAKQPSPALLYFSQVLGTERNFQLVADEGYDRAFPALKTRVMGYEKFFAQFV
jgi:predicted AAA+ superfamily ATPase